MTNSIDEIRDTDLMMVVGSNTTEAHPIIAMEMKRALHRGARLIVIDPRKIELTRWADLHLQLRPGTDVALLNGIARVIRDEGLVDRAWIEAHAEDWEAYERSLDAFPLPWVAAVTGVPAEEIRAAARMYATTKKAGIYYTLGITEHTHGTDNVLSLANLVMMTGHLGVRSAGLNPLRGQNNVQGANDAGATPIYLPGYQKVTDDEARGRFSAAWGVEVPPVNGLNLNEMMKEVVKGKLKGLFVIGEDIILSEPNSDPLAAAIERDDFFLVCVDLFLNETGKRADVVLPAACFAEKDGVFTNSDRRVQRVRQAVPPPGQALADWRILVAFARAAGYPMPDYSGPAEIYAEMAALSPKFSGISHDRLEQNVRGLQWPCPDPTHPGTGTLHVDGPMRGKAPFSAVSYRASAELPDEAYPWVLSTGRTLYHYNAATQTRREPGPIAKQPRCFVEISAADAAAQGLEDGGEVRVVSRRGFVEAQVRVTGRVPAGVVWMPMHFPDAPANRLTNDAGDAVTGTGEYKVCAVRIERVRAEAAK